MTVSVKLNLGPSYGYGGGWAPELPTEKVYPSENYDPYKTVLQAATAVGKQLTDENLAAYKAAVDAVTGSAADGKIHFPPDMLKKQWALVTEKGWVVDTQHLYTIPSSVMDPKDLLNQVTSKFRLPESPKIDNTLGGPAGRAGLQEIIPLIAQANLAREGYERSKGDPDRQKHFEEEAAKFNKKAKEALENQAKDNKGALDLRGDFSSSIPMPDGKLRKLTFNLTDTVEGGVLKKHPNDYGMQYSHLSVDQAYGEISRQLSQHCVGLAPKEYSSEAQKHALALNDITVKLKNLNPINGATIKEALGIQAAKDPAEMAKELAAHLEQVVPERRQEFMDALNAKVEAIPDGGPEKEKLQYLSKGLAGAIQNMNAGKSPAISPPQTVTDQEFEALAALKFKDDKENRAYQNLIQSARQQRDMEKNNPFGAMIMGLLKNLLGVKDETPEQFVESHNAEDLQPVSEQLKGKLPQSLKDKVTVGAAAPATSAPTPSSGQTVPATALPELPRIVPPARNNGYNDAVAHAQQRLEQLGFATDAGGAKDGVVDGVAGKTTSHSVTLVEAELKKMGVEVQRHVAGKADAALAAALDGLSAQNKASLAQIASAGNYDQAAAVNAAVAAVKKAPTANQAR